MFQVFPILLLLILQGASRGDSLASGASGELLRARLEKMSQGSLCPDQHPDSNAATIAAAPAGSSTSLALALLLAFDLVPPEPAQVPAVPEADSWEPVPPPNGSKTEAPHLGHVRFRDGPR